MCMFNTPKAQAMNMPPEYTAQKSPTDKDTAGAGKRVKNQMRAKASTMLTGSSGVSAADTSGRKVLLGQ